jgi:hypothetical protein
MRRRCNRNWQVESLEGRRMMAGDVDAYAIGNALYIKGDDTANGIVITSSSEGVIDVIGIEQSGDSTLINGYTSQSFTNIKYVISSLDDGDDALILTNLPLDKSVSIQTGDGNDFIGLGEFDNTGFVDEIVDDLLGALTIGDTLAIDMGAEDNTLLARNVDTSLTSIATHEGDDTITLESQGSADDSDYLPGFTASKGLALYTGEGTNSVTLKGVVVSNLSVILGDGNDTVSLANVSATKATNIAGYDGTNTVAIDEVSSKSLIVSFGIGNDNVSLNRVTVAKGIALHDSYGNDLVALHEVSSKSLAISLGSGNDELTLDDISVTKSLSIRSAEGDDSLSLNGIIAKSLDVSLGSGDDELSFTNVAITNTTTVDGNNGSDSVVVDGLRSKSLKITLGNGDDEISLQHAQIASTGTIDGGKDNNVYTDVGSNSFAKLNRKNFQTIV